MHFPFILKNVSVYNPKLRSPWHLPRRRHLKLLQKPVSTPISAAWSDPCSKKAINKHSFSRATWCVSHLIRPTRGHTRTQQQIKHTHTYSLQYWNTLCQRSPPGKGSAWMLVILRLQTASSGQRTARGCLRTLQEGQEHRKTDAIFTAYLLISIFSKSCDDVQHHPRSTCSILYYRGNTPLCASPHISFC